MSRRPEFWTHDPAVNAMALAKCSTLAKGVDAALGDLAWVTGFPGCSVALGDAKRHCSDVADLDPPLAELVAAGRWRNENGILTSLYLLDRQAEVVAFKAMKAASGKKGGTKKAANAKRGLGPQLVLDIPAPGLAEPSSAREIVAEVSTPYPEQNSSSVLPSGETELRQAGLSADGQPMPADIVAMIQRFSLPPSRRHPQPI